MTAEEIEIQGNDGLRITIGLPRMFQDKNVPELDEMMENMMQKLFGSSKVRMFLAVADEQTAVISYTSQRPARRALAVVQKGKPSLANNASVAKAAALLPPHVPLVGFLSPRGTVAFINGMIGTMATLSGPAPSGTPQEALASFRVPEFPQTPPIGFAVATTDIEVQGHLVVSADLLKAIGQYITTVAGTKFAPNPGP